MWNNPAAADLARQVAAYLPGWRFDSIETDEYQDAELIGPNRMRLCLRESWQHKNMVKISGRGVHGCSINCSITRKPRAIAQDIARRLLPDYRQKFAAKQAQDAETAAKREHTETIAQCFERLGYSRRHTWQSGHAQITLYGPAQILVYGETCDIECRLPAEYGLRVAALIAELQKEHASA